MKNLLEGIVLPVSDEALGDVCAMLMRRIFDHTQQYDIELSAPLAVLRQLRARCKHPGAKRGRNDVNGAWLICSICGTNE